MIPLKQAPSSNKKTTSWENVGSWYHDTVGQKGHYYHREVIIPKLLKLLDIRQREDFRLLDMGCGQGIITRYLPKDKGSYLGIDLSPKLIKIAHSLNPHPRRARFMIGDITEPFTFKEKPYTDALILFSLSDSGDPLAVFQNAFNQLEEGGKLWIVINHPCFRVPKHSDWVISKDKRTQLRAVSQYLSPKEEKIYTEPSKKERSAFTFCHHYSLGQLSRHLKEAGFVIEELHEWISNKSSYGANAKRENRAREEIPMFLAIEARK